jgi:hypothetical protein
MPRSLLRVNYEYSSKFKRGAVMDWCPLRAQVALGQKVLKILRAAGAAFV